MNKKGFTLVELLATIVIIILISGIAIVSYNYLVKKSSNSVFESYESTMHAEAIYHVANHYGSITFVNNKVVFTLDDLQIEKFNNPKNNGDTCPDSYVEATKSYVGNNLKMSYKVCLICKESNYNVDGLECKEYED